MPTIMVEVNGRDYLVDYQIQSATGNEAQRVKRPDFYNPAYVYDVKAFKQTNTRLYEVKSKKLINKITEILNGELINDTEHV